MDRMDEQTERGGGRDRRKSDRGGIRRRRFLGAAAAGAASTAMAGCDAGPSQPSGPEANHPHTMTGRSQLAVKGSADWPIRSLGAQGDIEGYTDRVSALPGEDFGLHVSTTSHAYRISAYRIGWYGGAQAALVWRSERIPGRLQEEPAMDPATRTIRTDWTAPVRVATHGWPEGAYLLRLDAESGHQRYVPMIIRSRGGAGRTVIMHAPATWQAYNRWGGYNLYAGEDGSYGTRSLAVTFDRPYELNGADKFMVYERAAVVLAERLGIPLAYTTGIDVHGDPSVLERATTAVSLGHDEYWTPQQRQHVTRARDAGTNLVFLGANTCFRRIRFEPTTAGTGRTVVCYKTDFHDDPYLKAHPTMATTDFRVPPAADPESSLTGVIYEGFPVDAPYVVHNADHWAFAGTGVKRGESFPHLVGVEYDRVTPGCPTPAPIEILAHSPLVCEGRPSHSDSAYYTVPSGAGVFASGTMRWVEGLMAGTRRDGRDHGMDARTARFVTRTTENVLRAFSTGPAAHHLPAPRDNVREIYGS